MSVREELNRRKKLRALFALRAALISLWKMGSPTAERTSEIYIYIYLYEKCNEALLFPHSKRCTDLCRCPMVMQTAAREGFDIAASDLYLPCGIV